METLVIMVMGFLPPNTIIDARKTLGKGQGVTNVTNLTELLFFDCVFAVNARNLAAKIWRAAFLACTFSVATASFAARREIKRLALLVQKRRKEQLNRRRNRLVTPVVAAPSVFPCFAAD